MADLSITVAEVLKGTGQFHTGVSGEAITAGQVCYLDTATTTIKLADTDLSSAAATIKGIALHASLTGQPIVLQTQGTVTIGATATVLSGTTYVLSATAGGIAPDADIVTTLDWKSIIGVGNANDGIDIKIQNSGNQLP